jgi:hypothetical protein
MCVSASGLIRDRAAFVTALVEHLKVMGDGRLIDEEATNAVLTDDQVRPI